MPSLLVTFSPKVPAHVRDLVRQVCAEAKIPLPDYVSWESRLEASSCGVTKVTRKGSSVSVAISVSAGTSGPDAVHCLLHELAHYIGSGSGAARREAAVALRGGGRRDPHNQAFFARAARLFAKYGSLPLSEAIAREVATYPSHRRDLAIGLREAGLGEHVETVWEANVARERAARKPVEVLVPVHPITPAASGTRTVCSGCGSRLSSAIVRECRLMAKLRLPTPQHSFVRRPAMPLPHLDEHNAD